MARRLTKSVINSISQNSVDHIECLVPSGLLHLAPGTPQPRLTPDGLAAVRLSWKDGYLLEPAPLLDHEPNPELMVLPRLVDAHVHLDKAFTWNEFPNLEGTYSGALAANLREHGTRTVERVVQRGERALQQAFQHGFRALRSHIDSGGEGADPSWEALLELQKRWCDRIELQFVALVPIAFWSSSEGERLAARVASAGGLLGGVLGPPYRAAETRRHLKALFELAERFCCGIDLHIDEADAAAGQGISQLLKVFDRMPVSVPITCSHASSLALLGKTALRQIGDRMAAARFQVISLPLTNAWLLGRVPDVTPVLRPQAPIRQLQRCGVQVAVAGDNVADPWFPGGDFDPLSLISASVPITQLLPWQRLGLAPFTTTAASLLQLSWDGTLHAGAPADLIRIEAGSWSELLNRPPSRRILVNGRWISSDVG